MKPIHVFLIISAFIVMYCGIQGIGPTPDFVLFKAFGYQFGINYTNNLGTKLLAMLLLIIGAIVIHENKKNDSEESQSV